MESCGAFSNSTEFDGKIPLNLNLNIQNNGLFEVSNLFNKTLDSLSNSFILQNEFINSNIPEYFSDNYLILNKPSIESINICIKDIISKDAFSEKVISSLLKEIKEVQNNYIKSAHFYIVRKIIKQLYDLSENGLKFIYNILKKIRVFKNNNSNIKVEIDDIYNKVSFEINKGFSENVCNETKIEENSNIKKPCYNLSNIIQETNNAKNNSLLTKKTKNINNINKIYTLNKINNNIKTISKSNNIKLIENQIKFEKKCLNLNNKEEYYEDLTTNRLNNDFLISDATTASNTTRNRSNSNKRNILKNIIYDSNIIKNNKIDNLKHLNNSNNNFSNITITSNDNSKENNSNINIKNIQQNNNNISNLSKKICENKFLFDPISLAKFNFNNNELDK